MHSGTLLEAGGTMGGWRLCGNLGGTVRAVSLRGPGSAVKGQRSLQATIRGWVAMGAGRHYVR